MAETNNGTDVVAKKGKDLFKGLKAEFHKISWTSKDDVTKQTVAVVVVSVILGLLIAVIDFLLQSGINFLVSL
ncbi:MAG: preprotein translocase subunit SecE [Lachnospiraceae bacterium]|nr:preprotein translocase subunit SecE [Lachnospiraceae bacterium]